MSLEPGTRLGPYEVVAPIGAGGMGEVYKARDSKLDRDVAVKVLPGHLAKDPDALARFEREAKAVAALSHPNILAIHDFGTHEGTAYAVAELLEGQTLRARLEESGALAPKKVVQIAADIARGLAAAHDKSIVHRDLKPENVFLTADGQVKILDFGLAKTVVSPAGDPDQTSLGSTAGDAATQLRTDPGMVMGTVGYMAPEQVKGHEADPRSDMFALGCVLFEMATGGRAFQRETNAETMTAILREDPPELAADGRTVSPALDEVVRHCLEKRPEERFQSARDLAFALRALSGAQTTSGRAAVPALDDTPSSQRRVLPWVAMAALVVAAFLAGRLSIPAVAPAASLPVSFEQLTDAQGVESEPTLSPDGRNVAYVSRATGNADIFLLRVGGRNPSPLTVSQADDNQPAFSPDGEKIAFRSAREGGGVFLMGSTGESITRLTNFGFNPSWSPDGREIVVSSSSFAFPTDRAGSRSIELWAVDVETEERRLVANVADAVQPNWSPNGHRIAFWGLQANSGQRDLWTVAADGSEQDNGAVEVTNDAALDWSPVWSPDGRYLYFSSNRSGTMNLWRVPIEERSGRVLGEPEPMTTPSTWSGEVSFSSDGTLLAYASLDWRSRLMRVAFDSQSGRLTDAPVAMLEGTQAVRDHELSPDGERIAFNQIGGQEDVFVARTDGSEFRRLTNDEFRDRGPTWSPSGDRLAFYSDRSGGYQLWAIRPDGSGLEQLTQFDQGSVNFPVWSPDGLTIAAGALPDGGQLFEATASATPAQRALPQIDGSGFWPLSWSANGLLAGIEVLPSGNVSRVVSLDIGTGEFTIALEDTDPEWKVPIWLADGRRMLVRDSEGVSLVDSATRQAVRLLTVRGYYVGRSVGISRDNRWITYTETGTQGDIWLATIK